MQKTVNALIIVYLSFNENYVIGMFISLQVYLQKYRL